MFSADIEIKGITFQVSGEWVPYVPERITADPDTSRPAEGGYFTNVVIRHYGVDLYEVLHDDILDRICYRLHEAYKG